MGIKEILNKFKNKNETYKEIKAQDNALHKIEQRKLSAEERALNKILEQQRQESIKKELNKIYKQKDKEYWKKDIISQENIFKGKSTLLNNKNLLINNGRLF